MDRVQKETEKNSHWLSSEGSESFSSEDVTNSSDEEQQVLATIRQTTGASNARIPSTPGSGQNPPRLHSRSDAGSSFTNPATTRNTDRHEPGASASLVVYAAKPASSQLSAEERRETASRHHALMQAAENGLIAQVQELIKSGIDLNKRDFDGYTALHHAAENGHFRVVDDLIAHGADPLAVTPSAYTALALAASHGHGAIVEYLISYHGVSALPTRGKLSTAKLAPAQFTTANPAAPATTSARSDSPDPEPGQTASRVNPYIYELIAAECAVGGEDEQVERLVLAVKGGNLPTAARTIAALAKVRASGAVLPGCMHITENDNGGRSLLAQACLRGDTDMATLLLCAGATIDQVDNLGDTALMHAVKEKQVGVVAMLLKAGASVQLTNKVGHSALSLAIDTGDVKVLNALQNGQVDIWHSTAWGEPLLYHAAESKKEAIVRALLQARADMPDAHGSKSLAVFAQRGNKDAVAVLLKAGADPDHKASDGHTAFTLAAANGRESVATVLLKHRARVEWKQQLQAQTDNQGRTALMLAVLNKKQDMVEYLLKNHANPHQRDRDGRTALLWAAARADANMMALLILYCATHVCRDNSDNTMFIIAAANDNCDLLRAICTPYYQNSQFDINTPNKDGDSALIEAARHGFVDTVQLLLDNGANVLHANAEGRTALLEATEKGHMEVIRILKEKEVSIPPVYPYLNAALQALSVVPLISRLLPERIPVRTREFDNDGNSAMLLAAENGQDALLNALFGTETESRSEGEFEQSEVGELALVPRADNVLVRPGAPLKVNIEERNREGLNMLCMATRRGHYNTIKLLLENGARAHGALHSPNGNPFCGITPLWLAARLAKCAPVAGNSSMPTAIASTPEMVVHLLLKSGAAADLETLSGPGQTPLIAAAGAGIVGVVKLLIDAGAEVNRPDMHTLTPLMHASHYGHLDVVHLLLNNGAQPDPRPGEISALILAAESGHDDIVSLLFARGAKIDHEDMTGATALISAAKSRRTSTVKLLVKLGADLKHIDDRDLTALDYAKRAGSHDIRKLLEQGSPAPRDK